MTDMKVKAWHIQNLIEAEPDCQVVELCVAEELDRKHKALAEQNKALREALKEFLNTRDVFGIGYAAFDLACKNAGKILTQTGETND